jgi:DNA polymerase
MMSQNDNETAQLLSALEWHLAHGADDLWESGPVDRTAIPSMTQVAQQMAQSETQAPTPQTPAKIIQQSEEKAAANVILGTHEAVAKAQKLANNCQSLEDLKQAIQDFDGLSVKQTASNMVFSDGNPDSDIMLIGEAPGADEDIQGKPFVGASGQLLDKILACIGLSRQSEVTDRAVYISNILNWRPPGNRTPTASEMAISLPFIKKHIELAKPKALILCGGVVAQTLLERKETISKLRGKFYDYDRGDGLAIPVMVTYHPAYLLRTPVQKRAVWMDMLMFQEKLENL